MYQNNWSYNLEFGSSYSFRDATFFEELPFSEQSPLRSCHFFRIQSFQVTRIWRDFPAFFKRHRIPPAFLKYVFFPAFSKTCYSFSLRSLFFLKAYIFLRNTFKRGYFKSFFALLSCVVARSLKYRLVHSYCLNHQDHTVPKNR